MSAVQQNLQNLVSQPYKHGFITNIESDVAPKGLNEDTIRMISAKKNEPEWLLEFLAMSYQYLVGAEIDYKDDLDGAQFVIKNNPGATSTCGCGSSFSAS